MAALANVRDGGDVRVAGIVKNCQRPGTTARVIFVTLGDATGWTNLIIWPRALSSHRQAAMTSKLADVVDQLRTNHVGVRHMMASRVEDAGDMLGTVQLSGHDFRSRSNSPPFKTYEPVVTLKNDDPRIADVHALMRSALDWFRGELQRLGPLKAPAPALFVTMAQGLVVGMPLAPLESGMNFTLVTCHQVLRRLDPVNYVYVCDVRTGVVLLYTALTAAVDTPAGTQRSPRNIASTATRSR